MKTDVAPAQDSPAPKPLPTADAGEINAIAGPDGEGPDAGDAGLDAGAAPTALDAWSAVTPEVVDLVAIVCTGWRWPDELRPPLAAKLAALLNVVAPGGISSRESWPTWVKALFALGGVGLAMAPIAMLNRDERTGKFLPLIKTAPALAPAEQSAATQPAGGDDGAGKA